MIIETFNYSKLQLTEKRCIQGRTLSGWESRSGIKYLGTHLLEKNYFPIEICFGQSYVRVCVQLSQIPGMRLEQILLMLRSH